MHLFWDKLLIRAYQVSVIKLKGIIIFINTSMHVYIYEEESLHNMLTNSDGEYKQSIWLLGHTKFLSKAFIVNVKLGDELSMQQNKSIITI